MGRYGMAGDHYRQAGYVTLQDVPDPNRVYVESFRNLAGGINRFDLPYHLKGNESPFMQNLSWHNGTLTSRLGQVRFQLNDILFGAVTCAQFLFHGWLFVHQQNGRIVAVKIQNDPGEEHPVPPGTVRDPDILADDPGYLPEDPAEPPGELPPVVEPNAGTDKGVFVQYRDQVIYKNHGNMILLGWEESRRYYDSTEGQYVTEYDVPTIHGVREDEVLFPSNYIPTIQTNSDPSTGAGYQFQQENRLSSWKKIMYNAASGVADYYLPVDNVQEVRALVDGEYAYLTFTNNEPLPSDASVLATKVTFNTAPPVTNPPTNNTVEIWYRKENTAAYNSIMNSSCAAVFGGAQDLCFVVGGTDAQPNAYFWSGLGKGDAMDPTYFPMEQYNLAGDNDDPITAFGKQQNMLVVFQPHATGRAVFGTEKVNDLERVTMNYTRINAEIGCDLPGSLQLIDNNLVWCNRRYGVCRLKDSSAAYENNITVISRKINGDYRVSGLLNELAEVADDAVRSADTGKRYILVLGDQDGKAYEWNYEVSNQDNPSWFYHTNILGVGFVSLPNDVLYEVTADGKVATFEPVFSDFGDTAIEKIYDSPPRDFNSYDRVKNVKSMLFTTRGDSAARTQITYTCDYGSRVDATDLVVVPPVGATQGPYPKVFRRTPGYHNIHHLAFRLYNNTAGKDLNLISAEIYYEYRGRQR